MINKPALYELMKNCDSKYELVIIAAKHARDIIDSDPDMVVTSHVNPVSLSLTDIADENVHWRSRSAK